MTWALSQNLKAPEKLVLLLLAYRANPETEIADATLDKLASECGMSRSGIKKVIQRLVDADKVEVEIRTVEGGKNLPNRYKITFRDRGHDVTPVGLPGDRNRGPDVTTKAGSISDSSNTGPKLDFSSWPEPPGEIFLDAWLAHRKRKRAEVTELVMTAMGKELRAAAVIGWTVDQVLEEICFRNWQGFKATWLDPKTKKPPPGMAGAQNENGKRGGDYAQGRPSGNNRAPTSAFDRVADNARRRAAENAAGGSSAGPDIGDDDGGLWPQVDLNPRR